MNTELLDRFVASVKGSDILEMGLTPRYADQLKKSFKLHSFDIRTSALKFSATSRFKQNALVRLPFDDKMMSGLVAFKIIGNGDPLFLFKEMKRVSNGPILLIEDNIEALPIADFSTMDDMWLDVASLDGKTIEVDVSFSDFFKRHDISRMFSTPGGSLNKFNLLVPEDIGAEIGLLCRPN